MSRTNPPSKGNPQPTPSFRPAQPIDKSLLRPHYGRPQVYAGLLREITKLRKGQWIVVLVPKTALDYDGKKKHSATAYRAMANRITSAMKYAGVKPPPGCAFAKRQMVDGNLAVMVVAAGKEKE